MNVWKNRLLYGAIAGITLLAYNVILEIAGVVFAGGIMSFINFAIVTTVFIVSMVVGIRRHSNDHFEGYISFTQSFVHGFFIYLIADFINSLKEWYYISFMDGKQEFLMKAEGIFESLYGSGNSEYSDSMMNIIDKMFSPVPFLFITLFSVAITALIVAVIVAAFTKKEKPF